MHRVWTSTWAPTSPSFQGWNSVKQCIEHLAVVGVGTAEENREGQSLAVHDDMTFGAELASIGGIAPG